MIECGNGSSKQCKNLKELNEFLKENVKKNG